METLCLLIDTVAMILVAYFSLRNDRLPPGVAEIGLFRIEEPAIRKARESAEKARKRRRVL